MKKADQPTVEPQRPIGLACGPGFCVCVVTVLVAAWAGAQQPLDWPQLQRDPARSGRTTSFAGPQVRAKWIWVDEQHITGNFQSQRDAKIAYRKRRTPIIGGDVQPIVAEGKVFFGTDDGQVFALNVSDASTVWKARTGGPILHTDVPDALIGNCTSMQNLLTAIEAFGKEKWASVGRH